MALEVLHATRVVNKPNRSEKSVSRDAWNEEHLVRGTPDTILGFDDEGDGVELTTAELKTSLAFNKNDVGLGNVDNTSDDSKPVSTATQTALNLKASISSLAASAGASLVGFIQSGVGAVARTLQNKARDTVSIKDFGAAGDGVADDTVALTSALATGREVFLPAGTYNITPSVFTDFLSLKIRGAGRDATKIVLSSTGTALTFSNCQWLQLSDFSIQPSGAAQTLANAIGIQLDTGSSNSIIERINFYGFSLDALRLVGTVGTTISGNVVRGCYFLGCGRNQLYATYNHDFTIDDNQFGQLSGITHADFGCLLENCQEGTYTKNKHWNNEVNFKSLNGNGNRYIGNRFEEADHEGVWLEGGFDELFEANTIHTNSQSGDGLYDNVYVKTTNRIIFTGNKIRTWNALFSKWGVNFDTGCDEITFGKNQIRGFDTTNLGPIRFDGTIARFSGDIAVTGTATGVAAGTTSYLSVGATTSESAAYIPVPSRYAVIGLAVSTDGAPGAAQTYTYTVRKNAVDTIMTCQSSGAASFSARAFSTSPQILVDNGDFLSIKLVTSAGATVSNHRFYLLLAEY